jgi:hypothetical protein
LDKKIEVSLYVSPACCAWAFSLTVVAADKTLSADGLVLFDALKGELCRGESKELSRFM